MSFKIYAIYAYGGEGEDIYDVVYECYTTKEAAEKRVNGLNILATPVCGYGPYEHWHVKILDVQGEPQ